ncbi:DUF1272 domain-containing protein [Ectobacillus ponti]|uniref:DUF1272 domain-containing protein n=1 Tax=Ectobacillus ponti TaxID=2961894 RepID=A0AA41X6L8_9BACI|nr:DUF1272 domain-containing protein [Ectobacillus ponti]MCP8969767.1 DUF1272 domain-containing protein [Ectobacillus ponti]
MALEMREACERCSAAVEESSLAYICVYECTFCAPCTEEMNYVCPNCGGELVRRPRKRQSAASVSSDGAC